MNPEVMNERWGKPGEIEFLAGRGGLSMIGLRHKSGATAEVYLQGAQVVSWKDANQRECLFLSERSEFAPGKSIRGGIPIVFPQFSGQGPLPAHGFLRQAPFEVQDSSVNPEGDLSLTLGFAATAETKRIWPHEFRVEVTVLLGPKLEVEFFVENTGRESFEFQNLLHTYFQIPDIAQIQVRGLGGATVVDFLQSNKELIEPESQKKILKFTDQLYKNAPDEVDILDAAGTPLFEIEKIQMCDFVLWNPWIEKTSQMKDMAPDAYKRFVCVEAGNVSKKIRLSPGGTFAATQRVRAI